VIEVFLKDHFADKTNWKQMLVISPDNFTIDLIKEKNKAISLLPAELKKYAIQEDKIYELNYPVPTSVSHPEHFSFEKEKTVQGILIGIKGQYLIFDNGKTVNFNNFSGFKVEMEIPGY